MVQSYVKMPKHALSLVSFPFSFVKRLPLQGFTTTIRKKWSILFPVLDFIRIFADKTAN